MCSAAADLDHAMRLAMDKIGMEHRQGQGASQHLELQQRICSLEEELQCLKAQLQK